MTPYEIIATILQPFEHPLYHRIQKLLVSAVRRRPYRPKVLDVGGQLSSCTIGLRANVTITELARFTRLQENLGLGATTETIKRVLRRRSNVVEYVIDDMSHTGLPDGTFDIVVAVEVLEHVEEDQLFLENVSRVLKSSGMFIMSTPNGDFVWNTNPDHKRHYTRDQLEKLLAESGFEATVQYCVLGTRVFFALGQRPRSFRRPLSTVASLAGNYTARLQERMVRVADRPWGTLHLLAVASKRGAGD